MSAPPTGAEPGAALPRLQVLIVKMSSLGDLVHMLPAVTDLAGWHPEAAIDWVAEEGFAGVPSLHPRVRTVIPIALRRWRRHPLSGWSELRGFRATLASRRYDLVIDTQGLVKSAFVSRLARGVRCGPDRASAREPLAALAYERRLAVPWGRHAVWRNRALVALAAGRPPPEAPPDYGLTLEPGAGAPGQPYVVCLHGTSRESKLWPEPRWRQLLGLLVARGLRAVLPWGSPAEAERSRRLAEGFDEAVEVPDRQSLERLAALLAGAVAVVGVDTGLAHLSVALGRCTIGIYTDTDPALTGLYPGSGTRALDLGGPGAPPTAEEVVERLRTLCGLP